MEQYRRPFQQDLHDPGGRKGDPAYPTRPALHTGAGLLTDKQHQPLHLFTVEVDVEVEVKATSGDHQRMTTASREHDRLRGKS